MKLQHRLAPLVIVLLAGCAASPRQRSVSGGSVGDGANSLTMVRQQLEGRWQLVSLNFAAEDGRKADVEASGMLSMDNFANLSIEFTMTDAGMKALSSLGITFPNPRVSTSGQAAINPASREITYVGTRFTTSGGMDPQTAARRQTPFALEPVRYYSFDEQGLLTLSTRYDDGKDAVVGKWKKAS